MLQHEAALGVNRLTGEDWQILDRAHEFLETFAEATLYAEGKSSIAQSVLIIEILLKKFEDEKVCLGIWDPTAHLLIHSAEEILFRT